MAILWESIQFNPKNQSKIQLDGKKGSKLTKQANFLRKKIEIAISKIFPKV